MAIGPSTQFETDPDKIDWLAAYEDKAYMNHLAVALVVFGAERFKAARIISGIPHLEAIHTQHKKGIITLDTAAKSVLPFMMDWLIDEIRICLFFENFMKAELISQGAIIHTFRDPNPLPKRRWCWQKQKLSKAQQLHRAQQKNPIDARSIADNGIIKEPHRTTITMELMMSKNYQQTIRIPAEVLEVVKRYNRNRNKLHLTSEVGGQLGTKLIDELKLLDAFVDQQLKRIVHS
ncbi:MAG: hypothetical protein JNM62_01740 [Flavobacteriales bacterium]|nr:hypothetical protein [Flavobacteriales bacterium]